MQNEQRLRRKIAELQKRWDLLTEKLSGLEKQYDLETRSEEKFRIKHVISEIQAERQNVEQQLSDLENKLPAEMRNVADNPAVRNEDQSSRDAPQTITATNHSSVSNVAQVQIHGDVIDSDVTVAGRGVVKGDKVNVKNIKADVVNVISQLNIEMPGNADETCQEKKKPEHKVKTPEIYRDTDVFDVFLAHNSQDKPQVEIIAKELKRRGLNPWLDKWNLPPGRLFQEEIERVLPFIKSVAVFVGPSGIGPWERVEMRAAISQFVKRNLPVIPVLLPGVTKEPELPLFLQEFSWVRFMDKINDPEVMDELVWGITGKHPKRT